MLFRYFLIIYPILSTYTIIILSIDVNQNHENQDFKYN